jgi:tellurite resistance protein TehA-like permease
MLFTSRHSHTLQYILVNLSVSSKTPSRASLSLLSCFHLRRSSSVVSRFNPFYHFHKSDHPAAINYAVPPGHVSPGFIYALFWIYVSAAVFVCFPMLMIWFNQKHDLATFTPAWAFLFFPMMLVGVVAFNVLKVIPPEDPRSIGVLLVGYAFQGLGSVITFFYVCVYFIRIMTTGFMEGHQANGAFVACGPPGFTALALINLGTHAQKMYVP